MDNRSTGKTGEDICENYLSKNGYRIVCRNFNCRFGEIDIIAESHDTIVFVEVKYRKTESFGNPVYSVTSGKRKKILLASEAYLQKNPSSKQVRFDIITIEGYNNNKLIHYKNAFINDCAEVL